MTYQVNEEAVAKILRDDSKKRSVGTSMPVYTVKSKTDLVEIRYSGDLEHDKQLANHIAASLNAFSGQGVQQ